MSSVTKRARKRSLTKVGNKKGAIAKNEKEETEAPASKKSRGRTPKAKKAASKFEQQLGKEVKNKEAAGNVNGVKNEIKAKVKRASSQTPKPSLRRQMKPVGGHETPVKPKMEKKSAVLSAKKRRLPERVHKAARAPLPDTKSPVIPLSPDPPLKRSSPIKTKLEDKNPPAKRGSPKKMTGAGEKSTVKKKAKGRPKKSVRVAVTEEKREIIMKKAGRQPKKGQATIAVKASKKEQGKNAGAKGRPVKKGNVKAKVARNRLRIGVEH